MREQINGFSRLYINFFQPSFKLKARWREGARVHKQYHPPETPYGQLIRRDDVSMEQKQALHQPMESLDPVLLLKHIREAQQRWRPTYLSLSSASRQHGGRVK